ncbi:MAG TPA: PAS domain-containing protein [Parvularculaceae bacterium]|nr:PAS domain-containing protein [Parvularculaceae bacterium]
MVAGLKSALANRPERRLVDDNLTTADRINVKIERYALLLRGAPIAAVVSLCNALITLGVAWGRIDPLAIGVWAFAVILLSLFRLMLWRRFSRTQAAGRGLLLFTKIHVAAMALNGVLWGSIAPIFAVSGMMSNAFLPFIIAGMTAAALASAAASWRSVLAFNVPALGAAAVSYGIFAEHDGLLIAAVIVLYGIATAYLAYTTQHMIVRSIRLRSRNDHLLTALTKQVDAAHEAEQRFRALVESSSEVTLIFSPEGEVTYASPAAEAAFCAPPQNIIGVSTQAMVHPDDFEQFRAVGGKTLSKIGEVIPLRHVCMRAPGGDYVNLTGRLTNMLYVPGVEGFVFSGAKVDDETCRHLPAAE